MNHKQDACPNVNTLQATKNSPGSYTLPFIYYALHTGVQTEMGKKKKKITECDFIPPGPF